ncbi:MAG: pantetheine-phosphate adenylyltransferase [Parachlamydiales bacterium]
MKALFAGTFDPPTLGHLDLIDRACRLFEHLIVGIPDEGGKGLFSPAQRLEMMKRVVAHLPRVEVASFSGLTAEYARRREVTVLLRGVRSTVDFEYEKGLTLSNRRINGYETLYLLSSGAHAYTSSAIIRDIARAGGDLRPFVPEVIVEEVAAQFRR